VLLSLFHVCFALFLLCFSQVGEDFFLLFVQHLVFVSFFSEFQLVISLTLVGSLNHHGSLPSKLIQLLLSHFLFFIKFFLRLFDFLIDPILQLVPLLVIYLMHQKYLLRSHVLAPRLPSLGIEHFVVREVPGTLEDRRGLESLQVLP